MNCNFLALVQSYKYDNEHPGSITKFFDWLGNCKILNKNTTP